MRIFSKIFRSRDRPENRTAGSGYTFYLGHNSTGKVVTERSAMQMTAVYSCVCILAEAIAGLPLHLYRYTDKDVFFIRSVSASDADYSNIFLVKHVAHIFNMENRFTTDLTVFGNGDDTG